jgi:hypothetical protein
MQLIWADIPSWGTSLSTSLNPPAQCAPALATASVIAIPRFVITPSVSTNSMKPAKALSDQEIIAALGGFIEDADWLYAAATYDVVRSRSHEVDLADVVVLRNQAPF